MNEIKKINKLSDNIQNKPILNCNLHNSEREFFSLCCRISICHECIVEHKMHTGFGVANCTNFSIQIENLKNKFEKKKEEIIKILDSIFHERINDFFKNHTYELQSFNRDFSDIYYKLEKIEQIKNLIKENEKSIKDRITQVFNIFIPKDNNDNIITNTNTPINISDYADDNLINSSSKEFSSSIQITINESLNKIEFKNCVDCGKKYSINPKENSWRVRCLPCYNKLSKCIKCEKRHKTEKFNIKKYICDNCLK